MAGLRVHIVMDPELVERIDSALVDGVSRGEFVRRAVERALAHGDGSAWREAERDVAERYGLEPAASEQALEGRPGASVSPGVQLPAPAPAEQPWDDDEAHHRAYREFASSSSQAKRDVRPVPKGGK